MKMHLMTGPSPGRRRDAGTDTDNPPWTEEELRRASAGRALRRLRLRLELTPEEFADRYGFDARELEAWEKGRALPDEEARGMLDRISDDHPEAKSFGP